MCVYVVSTQSFGAHQKGESSNRFSIYGTANSAVAVVVVGETAAVQYERWRWWI